MILARDLFCEEGYTTFCHLSNTQWFFYTLIVYFTCLPFIFIDDLKKFVAVNTLAVVLAFSALIYILTDLWSRLGQQNVADNMWDEEKVSNGVHVVFSFNHFLQFYGIASFSCEGVNLVLPIRNKMVDPRNFSKYLVSITVVVVLCSISLSVLAYFALGESIRSLIFENYFFGDESSGSLFYLIILYAVCLYINMPYFFYPLIQIFEEKDWTSKLFKVNFSFFSIFSN